MWVCQCSAVRETRVVSQSDVKGAIAKTAGGLTNFVKEKLKGAFGTGPVAEEIEKEVGALENDDEKAFIMGALETSDNPTEQKTQAKGLLGELIIFTHAGGSKDYQVDRVIHYSGVFAESHTPEKSLAVSL